MRAAPTAGEICKREIFARKAPLASTESSSVSSI